MIDLSEGGWDGFARARGLCLDFVCRVRLSRRNELVAAYQGHYTKVRSPEPVDVRGPDRICGRLL